MFSLASICIVQADSLDQANFPNLRRLFIESRSDDEEREVSRKAVRCPVSFLPFHEALDFSDGCDLNSSPHAIADTRPTQFYNAVLFMGSVAVFSLIAQRMNATR